jgi:hypothetical protein
MKEKEITPVAIDSLNLTIGKRTLQLTMDEARRLHSALAGVFGSSSCGCRFPTSWHSYTSASNGTGKLTATNASAVSDTWNNIIYKYDSN